MSATDSTEVPPFHLVVYSDAGELGGAEMTLGLLLGGLPPQIRVSVVCASEAVGEWLQNHRPEVFQVVEPIEDRSQVANMRAHRKIFRTLRPDIIQFNLNWAASCQWAIAVAMSIPKLKAIATENASIGTISSTSAMLKRVTSPKLRAHLAVGEATARVLEKNSGLATGSIETMYHGVEDVPLGVAHDGDGPVIVHVGRHDPVKGIDVLLDAMVLVDPGIRLVQIGGGPLTAELAAQVERLGLGDRVELRGVDWSVRVADGLSAFDLFVLPSRTEGLPVSIMEAMLAGLPIVSTDVGSVREEVTPGDNGLLVPPEDPAALAVAINELMADPARRVEMGRRSREIALERFTVAAMVDRYCDVYGRVLSGIGR